MLSVQNPSYSSQITDKQHDDHTSDLSSFREVSDLRKPTVATQENLQFSVRDYVCRERKKDIKHNWPFPHPYLQVCLDHGVKDILPPFEPPQSFKPWYTENLEASCPLSDDYGLKATVSCSEPTQLHDRSHGDEPSAVFIGGHLVSDNDQEGVGSVCCTSSRKLSTASSSEFGAAHHRVEGVASDLLVTSIDTMVKDGSSLPAIKCPTSSATGRINSKFVLPKSQTIHKLDGQDGRHPVSSDDKNAGAGSVGITLGMSVDPMASKICPVCGEFSSNSNTTLNAHIDQCLASGAELAPGGVCQRKYKVKPRKIKTMEDIYATARPRTLEELDLMNGTTWASNTASVPVDDFRESKRARPSDMNENCVDAGDSSAVYIDSNGTKLRILSQLNDGFTVCPELKKSSKIDDTERNPVSLADKSLTSGSGKLSRFKSQCKKVGMLMSHENQHKQNHRTTRGTHGQKKKKVSLHKEALERVQFPGTLKQWVGSKRTGVSRKIVVHDKQRDLAENNLVKDVALSAGDGFSPCLPGSMDDTVSASKPPDKRGKHSDDAIEENILCFGKKSLGKRSTVPKRNPKCKGVREKTPLEDSEKEVPSIANARKQIEQENDGSRVRTDSSSQIINCNLSCPGDSLEAETSMFIDYEDVSQNSELDSVNETSDVDSPMPEEVASACKLQPESRFQEAAQDDVDFHVGDLPTDPRPTSKEATPIMENPLSSLDIHSGVPTHFPITASAKPLPCSERSLCIEPSVAAQAEPITIPGGFCGKNSCFYNQINKDAVLRAQQSDNEIDGKHVENMQASVSQIVSGGLQEAPDTSAGGRNAFWATPSPAVRCNYPLVPGSSNLVGSQHRSSSSIYAAQIESTSLCKMFQPGAFSTHCMIPHNSYLRTSCHHFESTENSSGQFFHAYQPPPPPLHCITREHATYSRGEGCEVSAVCSDQRAFSQTNMSPGMFSHGCICSESRPYEGRFTSSPNPNMFNTNFTYSRPHSVSGYVLGSPVCSAGLVSKQIQHDTAKTSHPNCSFFNSSPGSEFCRSLPATNPILRLMGKNLMVANSNAERPPPPSSIDHQETKDRPGSDHPALVAYPGLHVSMPSQHPSNHNSDDACLIFPNSGSNLGKHKMSEHRVDWNDDISGHGGILPPRSCLQTSLHSETEGQLLYKKLIQDSGTCHSLDTEWPRINQSEESIPIWGSKHGKEIIIIDDSPRSCKTKPTYVDPAYCNFESYKLPINTVMMYQPSPHANWKPAEDLPSPSTRHRPPYAESSNGQFSFLSLPTGEHVNYASMVRPGKP